MAIDTGHGATLTLSTSALILNLTGMDLGQEDIPDVDATHLGTTGYREYLPGDLKEPGEITVPFQWNSEQTQINTGVVENITVTFPIATGQTNAATYAGTGYIKSVKRPNLATDQIQDGQLVIKFDGMTGPTYSVAS